jgi:hypothetical protein
MVTKYPIASRDGAAAANHAHTDGLGVLDRMRQMLCGLHGHDTLLHFEQGRMSLRCVSCGHETPGWELTEPTPTPTVAVRDDARRAANIRPHLVSARRIA